MVRMIAPAGRTGIIHSRHGGVLQILDGEVVVTNGADVPDLVKAGFAIATTRALDPIAEAVVDELESERVDGGEGVLPDGEAPSTDPAQGPHVTNDAEAAPTTAGGGGAAAPEAAGASAPAASVAS